MVLAPRIGLCGIRGGKQEHLALADRDLDRFAVFLDLDLDIALELVKKLFALVPVIILTRIRPADDHHDKILVVINTLIPNRRLEQVAMLVDPLFEIERAADHKKLAHEIHERH